MRRLMICLALSAPALLSGCRPGLDNDSRPYLVRRAEHHTKLVRKGEGPGKNKRVPPPAGVREVTYPSGDLRLTAWLAMPNRLVQGRQYPAVVYFHGGFDLGVEDIARDCKPFLDAGFIVLCPSLRGENGNAGYFEVLYGEADDGKAAVKWLAENVPLVDRKRIYTFGHSIGGGVSALLSLADDDVPIKHGGSAGGLYDIDFFDEMGRDCPFDRSDPKERRLRILISNIKDMKRPHYAYLGKEDRFRSEMNRARQENASCKGKLEVIEVYGDHQHCLTPAIEQYIERIRKEE
jgi:acetyl esterase/lipase